MQNGEDLLSMEGLKTPSSDARLVSGESKTEERSFDLTLRPTSLTEYIGQSKIKTSLSILLKAAKMRGESVEHILLYGNPGLGKTTLAHIIAKEMGVQIRVTSGPAIERPGDIAAILTNLGSGDILFIDEVHRLNHVVEEVLYTAMEERALDIVVGKGPAARTLRIDLPPFTIIGATTRLSLLTAPFRERFGNHFHLQYYEEDEVVEILKRSAQLLSFELAEDAGRTIARRSRRTPRIANRLLKRVRDVTQVAGDSCITTASSHQAFAMLELDEAGLDAVDRKILNTMIDRFAGGPVGLQTIAAMVAEEMETISEIYEPYLLQIGFLSRTPRGRLVTAEAYRHLGRTAPSQAQLLSI